MLYIDYYYFGGNVLLQCILLGIWFGFVDMNKEVTITNEMIASKCGWTPFHNYKVKGFPVGTIVNGILVMSEGKILVESKGQPLKF